MKNYLVQTGLLLLATSALIGCTTAGVGAEPPTPRPVLIESPTEFVPTPLPTLDVHAQNEAVEASKKAVLETGISEPYFDQHFKLLQVVDAAADRRVEWLFTVDEYETTLSDSLLEHYDIQNLLLATHDLTKTIPKSQAESLMKACIGDYRDEFIYYAAIPDTEEAGLYLVATSTTGTADTGGSWNVGYVNLETGTCIKHAGRAVIHPEAGP